MQNKTIVIGGDIVPTQTNLTFFEEGRLEEILDAELLRVLRESDFRIFNLETPIADVSTPIAKEGPCFRTSSKSVKGLLQLNPDLFTLANNHILDQGIPGLESTKKALCEANIAYTGIGENAADANTAYFFDLEGYRVGVYGCVEHEYTTATEKTPGANAFEPLEISDTVRAIKERCDCLIVLYHGGKEYYRYPSPLLQKRCRKMAESGADYILCQHSHCVGATEEYRGCRILYGQGNFLLDRYTDAYAEYFQTSLLVRIELRDGKSDWSFLPLMKKGRGVRLAEGGEAEEILAGLSRRSKEIKAEGFVEENFRAYAKKEAGRYIVRLSRLGYLFSAADNRLFKGKLLKFNIKKWMGKHQRMALQNSLQCEVHNEILQTYLKEDPK